MRSGGNFTLQIETRPENAGELVISIIVFSLIDEES